VDSIIQFMNEYTGIIKTNCTNMMCIHLPFVAH